MQPSDWISLAALGVAAVSVVVGPAVAARMSRRTRIHDEQCVTYAQAIHLLRDRLDEMQSAATYGRPSDSALDQQEIEAMIARLLLVGSRVVTDKVKEFFGGYWSVFLPVEQARSAAARGEDDIPARLVVQDVHDRLARLLHEIIARMRVDIGLR